MAATLISRKDASAQGLIKFFTNVPCRHAHFSERFVRDGGCVTCILKKNAGWAKRNPEKKRDSVRRWCAANAEHNDARLKAYHAEWYKANRAKKLAKNSLYLKAHPEIAKRASAKWRKANVEVVRASSREWEKANPDKRRALTKKNYAARPEHYKARNAQWVKDNPEKKAVVDRRRRAREAGAEGSHTAAEVAAILKAQNYSCVYCQTKLRKQKHLDHIMPLARGGSNSSDNLQWTCVPCNLSKNARHPLEFARHLGLLL